MALCRRTWWSDATRNVSLIDGYVPPSGSSYQIITFQSETGTFTRGSIDRHFGNPPVYDPGDVTLEAN